MLTIALLPVDGRPVTREMAVMLGEVAGVRVLTPPAELLGFWKQPGDREGLRRWLLEAAARADAVVVAGDMLAYGGLVSSRILPVTSEEALAHLAVLREIRAQRPTRPIYLFNTIMRISNADSANEEPDYWAAYGTRIWRWSYESHRGDGEAALAAARLVPRLLRQRYLALRESRFQVNRALLDWVREGVLDLLLFPQDDCAPYGFHVRERQALMGEAASLGLAGRVLAYPGADEVAAALMARAVHAMKSTRPRFFPVYSSGAGAQARTMYEDIPLGETVAHHVRAAGGELAADSASADILLAVHSPASAQGDWYLQEGLEGSPLPEGEIQRFAAQLRGWLREGRPVALADVCYANGADPALMAELERIQAPLEGLAAYSAWNTAGNTLGTAVAQAGLWLCHGSPARQAAQARFSLTRLADDYAYQSLVRPPYSQARQMSEAELGAAVIEPLTAAIRRLHAAHFSRFGLGLGPITFPWGRAFEVRVEIDLKEEGHS